MAKGAQDEAFLHGYTVLFGSTDNNYIQEEKFLDALKAKMVDGIIYVSFNPTTSEKLLENITVPVVFMDRKIKKRENMGSVLIDNFSAMKDVAAYIAGKGCRQPAGMLIRYIDQGMPLTDRILPYEIMERGTLYNMKTFNQFT